MEIVINRSRRHWWVFLLRGILFIIAGIYMIASPAITYIALGVMFGLIFFLAGIAELISAARDRASVNRAWYLMLGIIDVILGILLASQVMVGVTILRIIVGIWFLLKGVSLFSFSRVAGTRSVMLIVGGILTVVFALLILFNPTFGDLTIILWTAFAFIITGFFNVLLALGLKTISV